MNRNQRGMSIVIVLGIMSILLILSMVAAQDTINSFRVGNHEKIRTRAFYAAEAGANHVIGHYKKNLDSFSARKPAAAMGFLNSRPSSANFGADLGYWIAGILYDTRTPPTWVEVESRGTVIGTGVEQRIVTRLNAKIDSPFLWATFANTSLKITGGAYIDSYNSDIGPWTLATRRTNGNAGTNSTSAGAFSLLDGSNIHGSVAVGPGGNEETVINAGKPGAITGSRGPLKAPVDMTPKSAPSGLTPRTIQAGDTIPAGAYQVSGIHLSGGSEVRISGPVTLNVLGDFRMSGGSQLILEPTASLRLYVSGDFKVTGGSIVNQSQLPGNLQVFGTSTCRNVSFSGGAAFYGAIYAPSADADITGGAVVFGSIMANTIKYTGGGALHYDEALANIGEITGVKLVSWRWL